MIQFDLNVPGVVRPETAIQYYHASSVVLTLDGYNHTAALSDDLNSPSTPLPTWVDQGMLDRVNGTIGAEVPLVDANSVTFSSGARAAKSAGQVALLLSFLAMLQMP